MALLLKSKPFKEALPSGAIFKALEKTTHFIHIQYYIFEEGDLAQRFLKILHQKVKEGVEVRFLYDGLGSLALSNKYLKELK